MRLVIAILAFLMFSTVAQAQLEQGTYIWLSTRLADDVVETPESTGQTIELQISSEHEIFKYQNGALVDSGWWSVSYAFVDPYCLEIWQTSLGGGMSLAPYFPVLYLRNLDGDPYRLEIYFWTSAVEAEQVTLDAVKALYR